MSSPRTQIITDLRRDILEALDKYIYLSTPQTYRVIPKRGTGRQETWERALRRALQLSEDAGFITHGPTYEEKKNKRSGFATRKWVYFLTRDGAEKLAELRSSVTPGGIKVPPVPHYQRKPLSLEHETGVSERHISLAEAIRTQPNLVLHAICNDLKKLEFPQADRIFGIENTAAPRYSSTNWFMYEKERSRPNAVRQTDDFGKQAGIVRKLIAYDKARKERSASKHWSFIADFRVVMELETNERMMNLLKKLAGILPYRFLWITSKELIQEKGILEKVFYTPKDWKERSASFLDLTQ